MPILVALAIAGGLSLATGAAQERKVIRMQTLNVRDILYVLMGGGGNSLALMRDDGVVVIDTKQPGWSAPLAEAVEAVTDVPVSIIINTHAHEDHASGNAAFKSVPKIIAHERTKAAMAKMPAYSGANAKYLPNTLVTDRMTLLDGPDRMEIRYFGRGHTGGDLVVVFPEKRIAHLGDLFPGKAAPVIDMANGGSGVEFPDTLAKIVAELKGILRITTGHDEATLVMGNKDSGSTIVANPRTMSFRELQDYADFNRDFLAAVRQAIADGKTAAQAAATLQMPDRFKDYDMKQARANVEAIYKELGK
jgi:glyoxylase-like metal-dependent hydrolase (beta-lactamase superfamily II)